MGLGFLDHVPPSKVGFHRGPHVGSLCQQVGPGLLGKGSHVPKVSYKSVLRLQDLSFVTALPLLILASSVALLAPRDRGFLRRAVEVDQALNFLPDPFDLGLGLRFRLEVVEVPVL